MTNVKGEHDVVTSISAVMARDNNEKETDNDSTASVEYEAIITHPESGNDDFNPTDEFDFYDAQEEQEEDGDRNERKQRIEVTSSHLLDILENHQQSTAGATLTFREKVKDNSISEDMHPLLTPHAYPCSETSAIVPPRPPTTWPQRPLLLRPAPESKTRIRGIRYSGDCSSFIPLPGTNFCSGCTLPINNGLEKKGKSLVVDFETDLFVGTILVRIKNCNPAIPGNEQEMEESSYFHQKKRTFQAIVRGKFTSPDIPMSECVTGQIFRHPAGALPSKWILKGAVTLISTLAPQLQADFDGQQPRFLSPLVSTAQTVIADNQMEVMSGDGICQQCNTALNSNSNSNADHTPVDSMGSKFRWYRFFPGADESLEDIVTEPNAGDRTSVMNKLPNKRRVKKGSISSRMKARKSAFDKLFASKTTTPKFDTDTVYTFEFYQHMLVFDDFAVDLGRTMGKHKLANALNGQPLKVMGAHQHQKTSASKDRIDWLWNFDIWHESLYPLAVQNFEP